MSARVQTHSPLRCAAHPLPAIDLAAPLRLTRRGRLVLTMTSLLAAAVAFVGLAGPVTADEPGGPPPATASVVVGPGDSLWEIARQAAPGSDTRGVIAEIRRLNDLEGGAIAVGDRLVVPTR